MPRFFISSDNVHENTVKLTGENANHIAKSLRMKTGEYITVCDGQGMDFECELESIKVEEVLAKVIHKEPSKGEPSVCVTLFMSMPKGDKMELIVQKATELGVNKIVPYFSARCISKPDSKSMKRKIERWQKIIQEAAKQCGRGVIPEITDVVEFNKAVEMAKDHDMPLFLYECEKGNSIKEILNRQDFASASLMVGPEGGFERSEAEYAINNGITSVSIGTRILRCETAPMAGISAIMYHSNNF